MATVFTVSNQKGGAGKSTTAAALAAGLARRGFKVLTIDLDPQGNLSYTAQADPTRPTSLDILTGNATAQEAMQQTPGGLLIASSPGLSGADAFISETGKEYRLREALEPIREGLDFIVVDTPPALGILTVNALTACDRVIVPAQADIYSLQGIEQLTETIKPVRKYCNPRLQIDGILLTRYSPRAVLSRDIAKLARQMADKLHTRVYRTCIREAVAVREAQISRQDLFSYAPKAKVTQDYASFIDELIGGPQQ